MSSSTLVGLLGRSERTWPLVPGAAMALRKRSSPGLMKFPNIALATRSPRTSRRWSGNRAHRLAARCSLATGSLTRALAKQGSSSASIHRPVTLLESSTKMFRFEVLGPRLDTMLDLLDPIFLALISLSGIRDALTYLVV